MLLCDSNLCTPSSSNINDKLKVLIKGLESLKQRMDTTNHQLESMEHLGDLEERDNRPYRNIYNKRH